MTDEVVDIEKRIDWDAMYLLLSYGPGEIEDLAKALYESKVEAYETAVHAEAGRMGFEVDRGDVQLDNAQTKRHLRMQANQHARFIVNTHNKDLRKKIDELQSGDQYPLKNRFQLAKEVDEWAAERFEKRSTLISRTESFTPLMRGTIDFYRQNGMETDFIFDSDAASCDICKRLKATNPHPLRKVMRVGIPHPNCTHSWTPVLKSPIQPPGGALWLGGAYRAPEAS